MHMGTLFQITQKTLPVLMEALDTVDDGDTHPITFHVGNSKYTDLVFQNWDFWL